MSRADKSHIPLRSSAKHPMTSLAKQLVEFSVENRELFSQFHDSYFSRTDLLTPSMPRYDIQRECADELGLRDKLIAFFKMLAEQNRRKMTELHEHEDVPRPPPSKELYGRIAENTPFIDAGGFDGKRLLDFGNIQATIVDPAFTPEKGWKNGENRPYVAQEKEIVASFNAATRIPQEELDNSDGISIFPNVIEFSNRGLSKPVANGYYHSEKLDITERPYIGPTYDIDANYQATNHYIGRVIKFVLGDYVYLADPLGSSGIKTMEYCRDPTDASPKYDGVLCRIVLKKGHSLFTMAPGKTFALKSDAAQPEMDILVELGRDFDFFQLIKVNWYRNFKPFHNLALLEHFTRKVKISLEIEGKTLLLKAPERLTKQALADPNQREGSDGIVVRQFGEDFLYKDVNTVDVTKESFQRLVDNLKGTGYGVTGCDVPAGVHELTATKTGGSCSVVFKYLRPRTDRNEPNSDDYAVRLVQAKTVDELLDHHNQEALDDLDDTENDYDM